MYKVRYILKEQRRSSKLSLSTLRPDCVPNFWLFRILYQQWLQLYLCFFFILSDEATKRFFRVAIISRNTIKWGTKFEDPNYIRASDTFFFSVICFGDKGQKQFWTANFNKGQLLELYSLRTEGSVPSKRSKLLSTQAEVKKELLKNGNYEIPTTKAVPHGRSVV